MRQAEDHDIRGAAMRANRAPPSGRAGEGLSLRGTAPRWILGGLPACLIALTVALGLAALHGTGTAQEQLTFDVTLEPPKATVGDHLTLTIVALHPKGTRLTGPDSFAPLILIDAQTPATRDAGGGEEETRLTYVLAAFQTGELSPPPLGITALDGEGQETLIALEPPSVTIVSVLPAGPSELQDLKQPLAVADGAPAWIWATLLMAGFVGLTAATMALARLPVLHRPHPHPIAEPAETPDTAARRELDAIEASGLLEAGEVKEYYERISSCLRGYLARRFDTPAKAMTPKELATRLEAVGVERWPARLAVNLLEQCEAAQFAGYEPARERAEADLASAYEVVALTSPEERAAPREEKAPAPP